jgi:hypothetical protein
LEFLSKATTPPCGEKTAPGEKNATRIKNKRLRITDWMYNGFRQDGKMEILVYGVSNRASGAGFSRSAPRAGTRRTRSPGFAGAARALRRRPRARLAGSAPCGGGARWRGFESGAGTEPTRRSGFAANEGSAGRGWAGSNRRAPASPAQRRGGVRAEHAGVARRARPGGHSASARLPWADKSAAAALLVLFSAARARGSPLRRKCGGCARRCGFECGAGAEPARCATRRFPCHQGQRRP